MILVNLVFYSTIASQAYFLSNVDRAKTNECDRDIWLTRILVLNGLLFYVTWTTIASLINLAIAIQYVADTDGTTAAYIALSLLLPTILIYFTLEIVFDRYLRYAFAVYPVIIWALSAVVANNWESDNPTGPNIFSLVLLVLTIVLALLRVILFIIFTKYCPLGVKNENTVLCRLRNTCCVMTYESVTTVAQ